MAGDSRKSHSTHFTLKENGRKILSGMGHLCFQLHECHLAESLMASKRDIAKGQYVPDMSALAGAMRSRRSWIKEAKTNNCGGGGQSLTPSPAKMCGRSFGICSFSPSWADHLQWDRSGDTIWFFKWSGSYNQDSDTYISCLLHRKQSSFDWGRVTENDHPDHLHNNARDNGWKHLSFLTLLL